MPDCDLTNPAFTDEDEARKGWGRRGWRANGVVCPHLRLPRLRQAAWRQMDRGRAGITAIDAGRSLQFAPVRFTRSGHIRCTNGFWRRIFSRPRKRAFRRISCSECSGSARIVPLGSWRIVSARV